MCLDFITFFAIILVQYADCLENVSTGCTESSCLKCSPKGCIKCPNLIVFPSRKCVNTCPYGHKSSWSTYTDYMGRICTHNGNLMGLSSEAIAIVTGILTGTILCTIIITSAVYYLKHKRKNTSQSIESNSDIEESPERRKEFFKQLETFRPYAQTYLDMLNDTRKQLRELHKEGDNSAIAAYRPVVRDLAKILLILNRPVEQISLPEDWEHLFNWAEKTLKRYKRMSEVSQQQVAQLISFLQGPIGSSDQESGYLGGSQTMSTFKPDQILGSSLSLHDLAINNFNCNYDSGYHPSLNPQWKFEYSLVSNNAPSSEFNPALWKNSKEYLSNSLLLDDDFYQLGFRPQDEITTEL